MTDNESVVVAMGAISLTLIILLLAVSFMAGISLGIGYLIVKMLAALEVVAYSDTVVLGVSALVFFLWTLASGE
jgi:hypothetical protein